MKQCLQFNTSYLKQGCCRIPLQALCQFIHLIQEENGIVHPDSLQPIDDPARHAAHVSTPGKEWVWGKRVVTRGTGTSKISQIKLQAKQKNKEHCNSSCFFYKKFVELADKNMEYTTELIQTIIAADENLSSMVN